MDTPQSNKPEIKTEEKAKSKLISQETLKSRKFRIGAMVAGGFLIFIVGFAGGMAAGIHKARFSYRFGENYERNFMGSHRGTDGPRGPMGRMGDKFRDFEGGGFRNAHGLAGTIISITDNNLVVKDRDDKENTVTVSDKTVIKSGRDDIKISDLKNQDQVVVIGNPGDSGVINADFIRVFNNNNANDNNPDSTNPNNSGANNVDNSNSGI